MERLLKPTVLLLLVILCSPRIGIALTNEEIFSQFQFNYITPGARATAVGGAFIGLADDATAVDTNPAGLLKLYEPETSVEFKNISYIAEQIYKNRTCGQSIQKKEFTDRVNGVPFLSVVYPYNIKQKKIVFSAYRQESVKYKSSYRTDSFPIYSIADLCLRIYPIDASIDLSVTNYGLGIAMELFEGVSLGVSPRWSLLQLSSHSARFIADGVSLLDQEVSREYIINDDDSGFGINLGAMWELTPKFSIGMAYRGGTDFRVDIEEGRGKNIALDSDQSRFTLNLPDSFGIGAAVRAIDSGKSRLQLTMDILYIRYQNLLKDFDIILEGSESDDYEIDNATELHFGIEYGLKFNSLIQALYLRMGAYNDPDHGIRYAGPFQLVRDLFPGSKEYIHLTGGIGVVINKKFQIDSAVNLAESGTQVSLSSVYRF
ncbi:MAG: outer membrane protein transport protein [Tissierellales bacterium]|nr:outer membrane protein transport protein [Tissierellales bacterium]